MTEEPKRGIAADLLRNARWMAGLTQAEVAQRAGVTRQAVSSYEGGQRQPTVQTLDRLLAGCGMRLRLSVVPEPGLQDEPTRRLVAAPREERINPQYLPVLAALAGAAPTPESMLVSGKLAGQLHGAVVRAYNVEVLVSDQAPKPELERWLRAAGVRNPFADDQNDLRIRDALVYEEHILELDDVTVIVRIVPHFEGRLARSIAWSFSVPDLGLPGRYELRLDSPDDCVESWHPRDRERLAVQRAVRIEQEWQIAPESQWAATLGSDCAQASSPLPNQPVLSQVSRVPPEWADLFM